MFDYTARPDLLQGRVILVTGAGRGIGRAIAEKAAAEGGTVVVSDLDEETARETATTLGGEAIGIHTDVTDRDSVEEMVGQVTHRHGRIDVLVNNAGHGHLGAIEELTADELFALWQVNVQGAFRVMKAALPHLRAVAGCVVAVTTAATARYPVRDGLSAGPKGAVEQLVRALAAEEGRFGVRVNCVGPGMLTDGMAARLIDSGELDERALEVTRSNIPLRRFGSAGDVAEAVAFLCDARRAGFVSGQKLDVDGGYGV